MYMCIYIYVRGRREWTEKVAAIDYRSDKRERRRRGKKVQQEGRRCERENMKRRVEQRAQTSEGR